MKVPKEKQQVNITCHDNSFIKGTVHLNTGERVLDFINDTKENFIAVTDAEFYYLKELRSFTLLSRMLEKKDFVILNKAAIKLIEEFHIK
jgi:hypothetical protein